MTLKRNNHSLAIQLQCSVVLAVIFTTQTLSLLLHYSGIINNFSLLSVFLICSVIFCLLLFLNRPPNRPPRQPAVVARSPRRLLRSAGPGVRSGGPAVVQLRSAGAPPPGEPPHQSSPHQGHLHRQAAPGRGRSRSRRLAVGGASVSPNSHQRTASLFASPPVIRILLSPPPPPPLLPLYFPLG